MSDIEKLAAIADKADEILSLADEVQALRNEVAMFRQREHRALSSKEAAKILGVTSTTVVSWAKQGKLPAIFSRNGFKFPADRLFAIAEKQAEERSSTNITS